ncbi:unnamed protein product [Phytophthora fragariaefolia]|uniref:Unnamed protein product n=1 Tax=Phytophthora fragariaefolia TaxID=1490495 RepID=A0A9W6YP19_9STRA|nr:unnamed protein product [Phytophthora fragariaefolia]
MAPILSYSDTEDDDVSSEDGCTHSRQQSSNDLNGIHDNLSAGNFEEHLNAIIDDINVADKAISSLEQPDNAQKCKKEEIVALSDNTGVQWSEKVAVPSNMSSCSVHKHNKREERVRVARVKTKRRANKSNDKHISEEGCPAEQMLLGQEWPNEEPLPAVVCFGIAAAGTLAAMLCIYLN